MRVTSLRAWHWMLIGLLTGLACGVIRSACADFSDTLDGYGDCRITQQQFEQAITTRYRGRPGLTGIVIHPYRLSGAGTGAVLLHVVSGMYCDGQMHEENGRLAYQWKPAYFVASAPYRPTGPTPPGAGHAPSLVRAKLPDVMTFLDSQKASSGVQFRYANWWWAARPPFVWAVGGFVLVGMVWPIVINLLAYGRLTRPPQPKGLPLSDVRPPAPAAPPASVAAAVGELDRELDAQLSGPPGEPTPLKTAPAPRHLAGGPLEVASLPAGQAKEFGAKREDYYPTELGAKHEK